MHDSAMLRQLMARAGVSRVLAPCPEWPTPSGGVRKIYRHVDVLNANGIRAAVVHQQRGYRMPWFQNQTAVVFHDDVWPPRPDEILLAPELLSWQLMVMTPGVRKVVFNQNAYQVFNDPTPPISDLVAPYNHPDFLATIVVSEDSKRYINFGFAQHPVFRLHNSVDPAVFRYEPHKKRQIAFMPRKKRDDAIQIINLLSFRRQLNEFVVAQIHNVSEEESARILRESQIFLSLCTYEGSPLPPLEAMACGCIVVGYHGRGGAEYVNENYAFPIEAEDVVGFARTLEEILTALRTNPAPLLDKARRASEFVRNTYTLQREEQDIVATWWQILQIAADRRK
jgi:hypothetical protein